MAAVIQNQNPAQAEQGGSGTGAAGQQVYETLRRRILEFELPPDATLSRTDLAAEFGVSQTPIREAMHELEQDGLIRIYPQSRTVVTRIDVKQLHETQFLRVAVECEVVRRLAKAHRPETVRRARGILDMQGTLVGKIDQMDLFDELDRAFHQTLFEGVGMAGINATVQRRLGHLSRCQRLELPREGKMATIHGQHLAVLDGIKAGDGDAAAEAMRAHLSGTISRIASLRQEFPDYFIGGEIGASA